MGFPESQFTVDSVLTKIRNAQLTGLPPKNLDYLVSRRVSGAALFFKAENTLLSGQLVCEVKGVLVRIKMGSAPVDIYDGDFVGDYTGGHLTAHAIGSNNPIIINGLTNFSTYYVRFFPYSDHGIYNLSSTHTASVIPTDTMVYGFHQNFLDLNPDTSITYLLDAIGFTPIQANITTAPATNGSWPMWDWLQENLPYMVRKTGIKDYALDPNDYTKKLDGSASDVSNASYDGGAFAWLPKLYMKEVYAADGNSRDVYFARSNTGLYTSDFYPVGFVDPSNQVMEGVWLPMFYMAASGKNVAALAPLNTQTMAQFKTLIETFSIRGRFLGGPLMNLLRDVMYMLFRSTNIQKYGGYGRSFQSTWANGINTVVGGGRFYGQGDGITGQYYGKAFHSIILGTYNAKLVDPYLAASGATIYMCPNYNIVDFATLNGYINTGKSFSGSNGFRSALAKCGDLLGSLPIGSALGSSITGLCDTTSGTTTAGIYCGRRNGGGGTGTTASQYYGPGYADVVDLASVSSTNMNVGLLLLPTVGYKP